MKRGNWKTRKAWKQDVCRRSHGGPPLGYGHRGQALPLVDVNMAQRSFASLLVSMATSMFRRGNR